MAVSWSSTALFAAAPTRNASLLLKRTIPVSPSRLISSRVTFGMPSLVTYRMGASSGKWSKGTAEIAWSGSSGVTSVRPHGRSGTLLVSPGAFSGSAAGHMCCVTATASWKGSVPQIRVVVLVAMVGTRLGDSGGDGTLKSRPHTTPNGHRFGLGCGHPPVEGACLASKGGPVLAPPLVVAPLIAVGPPVVVGVCWALPHGVAIPMKYVMAQQ